VHKWVGAFAGIALLVGAVATPAAASPSTGVLDTSFHATGELAIGTAWSTSLFAPAPSDGLYLALRSSTSGNQPVHLTRLMNSGVFDSTFAFAGHTDLSLGIGGYNTPAALVPDGSGLLVALNDLDDHSFGLVRLTASGTPDPTFGRGGRVVFTHGTGDHTELIDTVNVLPDGRIEVVVRRDDSAVTRDDVTHAGGFDLIRLRADGSPDPTLAPFGIKNLVNWSSLGSGAFPQAAFTNDGKIYLALPYGTGRSILQRRTTTGAFDPTFNSNGVRPYACPDWQHIIGGATLRVDALGRPVLFCTLAAVLNPVQLDVFVARLTRSGAADSTFGSDGHVRAWMHAFGDIDEIVYGIDSTDRVVFAYLKSPGSPTHLHLARFTSAGAADATFGTAGTSTVAFGPQYSIGEAPLAFGGSRIYLSMYNAATQSEIAIAVTG
jgi:uncharacterized delta-60 repeat protein